MSGSAQEPDTRVAYLKRLSPEQLVAFVDGVLEENGATSPGPEDADSEGESLASSVAPDSPTDAGRELIALSARRRSANGGAIDLTRPCDVDSPEGSTQSLRN